MEDTVTVKVSCASCGQELPSTWASEPDGKKSLCPVCGTTARAFAVEAKTGIRVRDNVTARLRGAKKIGKKKFAKEMAVGWVPSKHQDSMVYKEWVIDRTSEPKWYLEKITDENGSVIHEVSHPLKDHKGHGSDKFRNEAKGDDAEGSK